LEIDPMIRLGAIETRLTENLSRQAANFFVLLDPDSLPTDKVIASGIAAAQGGADALPRMTFIYAELVIRAYAMV
jgi:hypothetical protein